VTGQGPTLEVTAKNIAFTPTTLTAPANTPFVIKFDNEDAGIPHDVVIHSGPDTSSSAQFDGEIFTGVATQSYQIPPLQPGTYAFSCKVHPNMTGTLTVQ
jgi:plastocyanin